jgi:non-ribosomal peptide synthetase-like protein
VLVTVPTLLSSIEEDIPGLRLINIGGEPVPQHLVELWAKPGRRILNTYGPTETTVTATWAEMVPGKPVTIGRPLPSYMVFIADEAGKQLPHGEIGEIYIGGIGVVRGYVKRPDLTEKCFIPDPDAEQGSNSRFYRTGDLGRYTEEGEIEYHGRADLQVKLRGYRIELSEIESILMKSEDVQAAVVAVVAISDGIDELVAYVIPKLDHNIDKTQLHDLLQEHLPHYMVPAYIEPINEFPVLTSGKIDRKALPKPGLTRLASNKPFVAPKGEMENKVSEAWKSVLRLDKISATDNFFLDLGGYSLLAAKTVSELRKDPEMAFLNLTDIYKSPTIEQLAHKVALHESNRSNTVRVQPSAKPDVEPTEKSTGNAVSMTAAQSLWLTAELLVGSALTYLGFFVVFPWLLPWLSSNFPLLSNLWQSDGIGLILLLLTLGPLLLIAVSLVFLPLSIAIAVGAKKILIGRYTPTRTPAWSSLHFRMWIMRKFMQFIPWGLIEGTEFQCMALRALGARIGKRVHIHHGVNLLQGGWDLLNIGDDVTLSHDASVVLVELEKGQVVLGPVTLEDGATLDVRSGVAPNTRVGRNARLTALSWLSEGSVIPDGEIWTGVPAQSVGMAPEPPMLNDTGKCLSPIVHGIAMILSQTLYNGFFALPYTVVLILFLKRFDSFDSLLSFLGNPAANLMLFGAIGVYMCLAQVSMVALEAVAARVLGAVKPGVISRWSLAYIRVWLKTGLVSSVDMWLSGSRNYPVWLRAAGMKVGRRSEIGSIMDVVPELVHVNNVSFFADGIYLGGPRIQKGTVTLADTHIENNVFLGNHVVVPAGQQLPEDLLIGVSTAADDRIMKAGSSWFGNPPFDLINREVVTADRSLTSEPSLIRIFNRSFWDWLRFTLPFVPTLIGMFWFSGVIYAEANLLPWAVVLFGIPAVTLACGASLPLVVLGLKWGLLCRVRKEPTRCIPAGPVVGTFSL